MLYIAYISGPVGGLGEGVDTPKILPAVIILPDT